jgi:hypothetical protein
MHVTEKQKTHGGSRQAKNKWRAPQGLSSPPLPLPASWNCGGGAESVSYKSESARGRCGAADVMDAGGVERAGGCGTASGGGAEESLVRRTVPLPLASWAEELTAAPLRSAADSKTGRVAAAVVDPAGVFDGLAVPAAGDTPLGAPAAARSGEDARGCCAPGANAKGAGAAAVGVA